MILIKFYIYNFYIIYIDNKEAFVHRQKQIEH